MKRLAENALPHGDSAYFTLVEKYFRKSGSDLRNNIDDQFVAYFEEIVSQLEQIDLEGKYQETIQKTRELDTTIGRQLVRQGLDVLSRKRQKADIGRIRSNMSSQFAPASASDIEFLGQFGSWEDVDRIVDAKADQSGRNVLAIFSDTGFEKSKARALHRIGRHDIARLFSLDIAATLKANIVRLCSESAISDLSDSLLLQLLNDEFATLRKSVALMAVKSLSIKRLRELLDKYVSSEDYRYYNSIHWLDLGVSMPRRQAKKIASTILDRLS